MKKIINKKIVFKNKHLTEKLEEDELIFAITIADVQLTALNKLGRELNHDEMYLVRKGVEWGFFDWEEIVNFAIDDLEMEEKTNDIIKT